MRHRRVPEGVESLCAFLVTQGSLNASVSACCIMNDEAAGCDGGLTFHSQLPLRVKNGSLCPPSRLGYHHIPPAYASQSPTAISLSAISRSLFWEPYLMLF